MKIIGIDPGLSGAIAVLENNKVLNIFDMPVMSEGKKNKRQLNSAQLVCLIKENIKFNEEITVVVEQVNAMPGQGVTSMFNFGQTFGAIKGVCAALELPIFFVRPSKWRKHFELISSKCFFHFDGLTKKTGNSKAAQTPLIAPKVWPKLNILVTP